MPDNETIGVEITRFGALYSNGNSFLRQQDGSPAEICIKADLTPIMGPTLDQYFGPWFMEEKSFINKVEFIQQIDLAAHIRQAKADAVVDAEAADNKPFEIIRGNIARIDIEGTMTKRGSSFGGGGTIATRRQIRTAVSDPEVAGIFLRIDSPGGTVAGTKDLADDVHQATRRKPVMAYFEDTGASAAYYVGSQATVKRANASAVIGSIGTVLVVMDMSEFAKSKGIKVHVVSTGPYKGAGAPGSEITEQHLAYFQSTINQGNELFLEDVSRGTNLSLSQVRELADGRVHMASRAVALGLIDGVASMDEALDELVSLSSPRRSISMSTNVPQPATLQELKAAFPEASSDFLVEQQLAGATLETATKAFIAHQASELTAAKQREEEARKEAAEAKAAAEEAKQKALQTMPGNSAEEDGGGEFQHTAKYSSATEQWKDEIQALVDNGMDRLQAVVKVDRDNPGLREKFLSEHKPQPGMKSQPAA